MNLDTNCTTAARESPAKTEPTAEKSASARSLMPVHVGEESLKGLSLFQTYLLSELVITPTDSSWREIAVADQERFVTDALEHPVGR